MEIPANILMSSGMYAYVAVKASIHAADSAIFGLNEDEVNALSKKYNNCVRKDIVNGILLKAPPISVVNALGQLGYKVVATTGEAEVMWTMQREL